MNTLKVGMVQQANTGDRAANIEKLKQNIRVCALQGVELVVLQELHNGLYFCQTENTEVFDQAEPIPGPSTEGFGALAKELGIVLVLSLFEKRAPGLYHNTAVVIEKDGTIAGKYRKMHIPDDPAYYEKFYFTPGDLGFEPIDTSVGKLGVLVCWDQWYPEAARLMAMKGAELLIYPTAIGWESSDTEDEKKRQLGAWVTVQRGHAVANGSLRLTGWGTRLIRPGKRMGFSSGETVSSLVCRVNFWPNFPIMMKKYELWRSIRRVARMSAVGGLSSEIAVSMLLVV